MTVVKPGGPCLTQTQIYRDQQQERFDKKLDGVRTEKIRAAQKDLLKTNAAPKIDEPARAQGSRGGNLDISV